MGASHRNREASREPTVRPGLEPVRRPLPLVVVSRSAGGVSLVMKAATQDHPSSHDTYGTTSTSAEAPSNRIAHRTPLEGSPPSGPGASQIQVRGVRATNHAPHSGADHQKSELGSLTRHRGGPPSHETLDFQVANLVPSSSVPQVFARPREDVTLWELQVQQGQNLRLTRTACRTEPGARGTKASSTVCVRPIDTEPLARASVRVLTVAARAADMLDAPAGEIGRALLRRVCHLGDRNRQNAEMSGRLVKVEVVHADEVLELLPAPSARISSP